MKLSELFRQLSYGELKNHSMATAVKGQITADSQPELVIAINDGLLALYSRFILKEKDVIIEMQDGITNYHLTKQFAESASADKGDAIDDTPELGWQPTPYIKDLGGEPFEGDVIKILAVYDGHIYGSAYGAPRLSPYASGDSAAEYGTIQDCFYPFMGGVRGDNLSNTLPLNDTEDLFSLFTPQANVLQVPHPRPGHPLGVQYQAAHPILVDGDPNQWIELPKVLERALRAHVAQAVYGNMNGQENTISAQKYQAQYEAICGDVIDKDLVSSSQSNTNIRFHKRGWV